MRHILLGVALLGCAREHPRSVDGVTLPDGGPGAGDAGRAEAGPGGPGDGGGGGVPTADECGDLRVGSRIYYGTSAPTYVPLEPAQVDSVLQLSIRGGACSGTLIRERWVATARHCTDGASAEDVVVGFGAEPDLTGLYAGAVRIVEHGSADAALIELDRDPASVGAEAVPIASLTERMDSAWVGRTVEAAGYGEMESGALGVRKFVAVPIVDLDGEFLAIDGQGDHGVCFGDSGGPALAVASDGSVRVAGVLSWGDGSCVGVDNFTRLDVLVDWVERYAGPTPSAPGGGPGTGDPCTRLGTRGACEGATARWCEGGVIRERDCAACGERCAVLSEMGGAYCEADPCGGIDYLGRCEGDVSVYCKDGELVRRDCAERGRRCGWVDDETGYYCL